MASTSVAAAAAPRASTSRLEDYHMGYASAATVGGSAMRRSVSSAMPRAAKPFDLGEVARAALANPRRLPPWASTSSPSTSSAGWNSSPLAEEAESDSESSSISSSPQFSAFSSPFSSTPSSPFTEPSSCELSPSNSSEGFPLGSPCVPCAPIHAAPAPATIPSLPPSPPRQANRLRPARSALPLAPSTRQLVLSATPSESGDTSWNPKGFALRLTFTNLRREAGSPRDEESSLPPAFFPTQRIAFAPRLRVTAREGLAYSALGGMQMGITGICETLNPDGTVNSKRMIADYVTDLSSGLAVWKRDADSSRSRRSGQSPVEVLPPGTYMLPLSMNLPNNGRLPPSFECAQYRISYTMSIALFSSAKSSTGVPLQLKVFSVPFHLLPSTLPSPAPKLPILTHDHKKSGFSSIMKAFSFSNQAARSEAGYHVVIPSIPTSHFSPASMASIPVSLRIVDRPIEPTDLYVRLALVRKTYVRESSRVSLAAAIEDEWGLGAGVSPLSLGYPEEVVVEPWCRDEEEIVSRWGWIPYSARPGADPNEKAEVLIQDIALPLSGLVDDAGLAQGWDHGYSTSLDLEPTPVPSMVHGECSWFSPAFRTRPPVTKEYGKHIHVSTRFFVAVEIGFATPALKDTLAELKAQSPDMDMAKPNGFTQPRRPGTSKISGASTTNPFVSAAGRSKNSNQSPSLSQAPVFPGKMRELLIPITIGSVAEPALNCLNLEGDTATRRAQRAAREDRGEENRGEGEGPDGAWLCAPPRYEDAVKTAPAYLP